MEFNKFVYITIVNILNSRPQPGTLTYALDPNHEPLDTHWGPNPKPLGIYDPDPSISRNSPPKHLKLEVLPGPNHGP